MNSFLSTEDDLEDLTDIWLRILLWAFITTALVYSTAGIYSAVTWRRTKPMVFACPLLYLLFGAVKFVIVDLITCLLIASIYNAASWETSGLAALGWGIGLSLASTTANIIISCVPLYTIM